MMMLSSSRLLAALLVVLAITTLHAADAILLHEGNHSLALDSPPDQPLLRGAKDSLASCDGRYNIWSGSQCVPCLSYWTNNQQAYFGTDVFGVYGCISPYTCPTNGAWSVAANKCQCKPGYAWNGASCALVGGSTTIADWVTCPSPSQDTCASSGWVCCVAPADVSSGKQTCRPGGTECASSSPQPEKKWGACGPGYGSCGKNNCCSQYGFCGISDAYCGDGCQSGYGACASDIPLISHFQEGVGSGGRFTKVLVRSDSITMNMQAQEPYNNGPVSVASIMDAISSVCPRDGCYQASTNIEASTFQPGQQTPGSSTFPYCDSELDKSSCGYYTGTYDVPYSSCTFTVTEQFDSRNLQTGDVLRAALRVTLENTYAAAPQQSGLNRCTRWMYLCFIPLPWACSDCQSTAVVDAYMMPKGVSINIYTDEGADAGLLTLDVSCPSVDDAALCADNSGKYTGIAGALIALIGAIPGVGTAIAVSAAVAGAVLGSVSVVCG